MKEGVAIGKNEGRFQNLERLSNGFVRAWKGMGGEGEGGRKERERQRQLRVKGWRISRLRYR